MRCLLSDLELLKIDMNYLVCVDGSEYSRNAFHFTVGKLSKDNDKITIIHVTHNVKTSLIDPLGDNLDKITNIEEMELSEKIKRTYESECKALKVYKNISFNISLFNKLNNNIFNINTNNNNNNNKQVKWEFTNIKSESNTGEAVMQAIEIIKPDMVVVGTRGLNKLKRIILGSTSNYLINNSTIPVLVVPPHEVHLHKD
ncbi:hypothetical protein PPL_08739 [Heterostelium album PN500]|uniref:UspA domain-containing protein n=1 Tax=Heterostelium pallidum (strain ATCC 26659 / Pp 5 / PN500) TaxID=670386 RepID=D3BJL1_HETP5|nr:hypothetical protein PPL_08739 [Heterostelium album PN500]EFA78091.1 hypothetical protein PPL_08739 [Heterostelium album PN500]|eukprot:XP_020430218.1 hypothetical protein PPL_08739 [Heterostelium album PN500]